VSEQATGAPQVRSGGAAEAAEHWRALRERLEDRIRAIDGPEVVATERRRERLLRLRRLQAKVLTRERLAVLSVGSEAHDAELRRA
jgi:hypothetical protein